jgi:hypothetical protein
MARGIKNRVTLICPNCNKEFEIIKSRLHLSSVHYCSHKCLSVYTAKQRGDKQRIREYPFKCGVCIQCGKDIMAKNGQFVKKNRKFCSVSCKTTYQNLTNNPMNNLESRKKAGKAISIKLKGIKRSDEFKKTSRINNLGEKSHFWRGGLTDKNRLMRTCAKTKDWRESVFKRDNWTCQVCGARNGNGRNVYLSAHHIKSWSKHPESRYDLNNGTTLCKDCHKKTPNFAYKSQFQIEL